MGHRNLNNKIQLFQPDQDLDPRNRTAEMPDMPTGMAVVPGNGSFTYPMENVPRSGLYHATQQHIDSRPVEHFSSSFRLGDPHIRASHSASYESFPHLAGVGRFFANPDSEIRHGYTSPYNRHIVQEVEDGLLDFSVNTCRGPFKRKSPDISLDRESGSTSRFYSAGSSSNSSEFHLKNQAPDYQNRPSSSTGIPHHRGGSLSISSEDGLRNVRSRSTTDMDPNLRRTHLSSDSSHHYSSTGHPMNNSGRLDFTCFNADGTIYNQNHTGFHPPGHRRFAESGNSSLRHEMNHCFGGGSTAENGGYSHEHIPSRDPCSSTRYPVGLHVQAVRQGHNNYSQRSVPLLSNSAGSSQLGQPAPTENGLQFTPETCSSRFPRSFSARGWRNHHRETRSRITIGRVQSISNAVNAHSRMDSEALIEGRLHLYGSRGLFDQYRDMRLNIDNMTYEELLALGERIGTVNTGLSEAVISDCLKKTLYSPESSQEDVTCAICLEEYKINEEVGTVCCGHDYHFICIERWLLMKNACPICKAPARADTSKGE